MLIKIPDENILELKSKIKFVLGRKKVTLRDLQSLCGSLAF
jgi:flagellar motor switch/type III secretory pathway protein FliN